MDTITWIPDFIIEKLKEFERLRQERSDNRPRVYAPPPMPPLPRKDIESEDDTSRGPIIIDINSYEIIDEDE